MVLLSGREYVQVFLSFVYKCIVVDDPDIKRGFGIPLNGLTPPVIIYLQGGQQTILNDRKKFNNPPFHFCVTYVTPPPNSVRKMLTPPTFPPLCLHLLQMYDNPW